MGKTYERIEPALAAWIARQAMFFVGSAPSGDGGHVNVSPKGPISTLRLLDDHTLAYLDLVGSGAETIAHLRQNGRIVVMFCAFEGPPRILRLHGHGEVLDGEEIEFPDAPVLPQQRRAVIRVGVERIADSCGYGVPLMRYEGERRNSRAWAEGKLAKAGPDALEDYKAQHNAESIDGLPALSVPSAHGA
ncbi:MAG: pyridoxamine 5'-phosphate oxidase family protein [Candidatus Dormibacteraeota bacterium]|nr:pyridoxamine 5'-phosphate oxidase family protein [Candidatus Dormibacteraeota bacterium]